MFLPQSRNVANFGIVVFSTLGRNLFRFLAALLVWREVLRIRIFYSVNSVVKFFVYFGSRYAALGDGRCQQRCTIASLR